MKKQNYILISVLLLIALTFTGCFRSEDDPQPNASLLSDAADSDDALVEELNADDDDEDDDESGEEGESAETEVTETEEVVEASATEDTEVVEPEVATEEAVTEPATEETAPETPEVEAAAEETEASVDKADFRNGSYSVTTNYNRPGGTDAITVNVTVSSNLITAVTVNGHAEHAISRKHQLSFSRDAATLTVGKRIDEALIVGAVNGSSLTAKAFNNAVSQIRSQAALQGK